MSFLQKKAIPQTTFILHSLSLFLKSNNYESDPRYPDWLELQFDRLFPGFSIHHRAVQEILNHPDKRAKIIPLRLCSEEERTLADIEAAHRTEQAKRARCTDGEESKN